MNKAITDGLVFTPPTFSQGLDVWSSGDGTPGSDTYANNATAIFQPADQDFGGALEIQKTETTQKLRYMGKTPLPTGCYLRISTRVKVLSGPIPSVQIAGWAGGASDVHVTGITETGPAVRPPAYGEVIEVSAIVGSGKRDGVDMVWGRAPLYGHFGLDLTGANGAVVRIDDFTIEDVSGVFLSDMIGLVDVRDYGAIGDGTTDDSAAFEAADAAARGREVLVSEGLYLLNGHVTFDNPVRFQGRVTMPNDKILNLTRNYDLPTYIDAFGDEEMAFRKAVQSLFNSAGHNILDLGGRDIRLREPMDIQAAVSNKTSYAQQRMIANGRIAPSDSASWDTRVVTSTASYSVSDPFKLTNVTNIEAIEPGSLLEGTGVGREVYVWKVDVAAKELTLGQALYDAVGTQKFTFRRFRYLLDFSGFNALSKFILNNIEFNCSQTCSGVMLPPSGKNFNFQNCFFAQPKDRGITSIGTGCQGMEIDNCKFLSGESGTPATQRVTVGFNTNQNDVKVRHNRGVQFRHFAVMAGTSSLVLGNHFFQGDSGGIGPRLGGLVLTRTNNRATINGNYICDSSVEWTNEHDPFPDADGEFSFSSLSITDNVFLSQSTAPWFNFIIVKPYGPGHYINGLTVTGNSFRLIQGNIDRVEGIDDSISGVNFDRFTNITFRDNMFNNVNQPTISPVVVRHKQTSASSTWVISPSPKLPFKAYATTVESIVLDGPLKDSGGSTVYEMPYYLAKEGSNKDQVHLKWPRDVKGEVVITIRIDKPL